MLRPIRRFLVVALVAGIAVLAVALTVIEAPLARMAIRPLAQALAAAPIVGEGHPSAASLAARITRDLARRGVHAAASAVLENEALAQTRLDFKPVPEESAQAFERGTHAPRARHAGAVAIPTPPREPAAPAPDASTEPATPAEPAEPPTPSSTGNIVQIGSDIHIEKGQVVDGDVLSIGGDIRVDGHVRGNVSATRGDVTLGSTARVDRDVLCIGGTLHEEPGAYVGGQRVTGLEGRERLRERLRDRAERDIDVDESTIRHRGAALTRGIFYLLMWLGIAWLITHFAPTRTGTALKSLQEEPGLALGYGFGAVLLLVPSVVALAFVVVLLCITIVGIPVALGALFAYAALLIVLAGWGAVVGYAALGRRFANRSGHSGQTLTASALAGVLVIQLMLLSGHLLHMIPFMGGFGTLLRVLGIVGDSVLVLLGMGALLRSKFGQGPQGVWWPPQHLFRSIDPNAAAGSSTGGWWSPSGAPTPSPVAPVAPAPVAPAPVAPSPAAPTPVAPSPIAPEAGPLSASTPPEPPPPPATPIG